MKFNPLISRIIIILVFGLIGYCLASGIVVKSTMGVILAIVSLGATLVFLHYLPKLREAPSEEETA